MTLTGQCGGEKLCRYMVKVFHFIFIHLNRVKQQLYAHKLLYKLPCTKKKDNTKKFTIYKVEK